MQLRLIDGFAQGTFLRFAFGRLTGVRKKVPCAKPSTDFRVSIAEKQASLYSSEPDW
jgi:hypothetical protein